ncbi:MAG: peptidoglycan-associated lipoprotein Pal [Gammaproteobacteria bacterium]|nr:peptidoglycan-associated lipoprotein Pal [Gammaproteobacteria bacterium]
MLGCGTTGSAIKGDDTAGSSAPAEESGAASSVAAPDDSGFSGNALSDGSSAPAAFSGDPLDDPSSLLSKRVIYFDYDRSSVKPQYRAVIEAHAAYMADHPAARVTLEGHADERGSREYNMALGERRAQAVRRLLALQGASAVQLDVVSFGEERPAVMGHNEMSWERNRRVELVYAGR